MVRLYHPRLFKVKNPVKTMAEPEAAALLLVDIQPDFMPGGALAVAGGDEIVAPAAAMMDSGRFRCCIATQDWHPPGHVSFASRHPGRKPFETIDLYGHEQTLWPDHCVQDTPGAQLHPDLPMTKIDAIIRKGGDPTVDSYSGFRNNWNAAGERPPTGVAGYLRERGVTSLYIWAVARRVCVVDCRRCRGGAFRGLFSVGPDAAGGR